MAIKALKGLRALHEVEPPSQIESVSDGVAAALMAIREEDHGAAMPLGSLEAAEAEEQRVNELPPEMRAEQSRPSDRAAPPAPSLFVSGSDAIRVAGEATEADRVREYGLLAEIDAKLSANADQMDQIKAVITATETTLTAARNTESETFKAWEELQAQRVETVDRILKLNQMTIDNEAARLRRGQ